MPQIRSGYTLPVFACAAAIAALRHLHQETISNTVSLDLITPAEIVEIPVEQVAKINHNTALAITRSDPGDNLDLTRNTPIWAIVARETGGNNEQPSIIIKGGEGIGKQLNFDEKAAIYQYAQNLLQTNLKKLLKSQEKITVTIILPEGRRLAERTSNEAFGVVGGLSLLGTSGISEPLSAPEQLEAYQQEVKAKASQFACLVFCVGENGLDLAQQMGINPQQLIKTANWLGPLLVTAGLQSVKEILLFGYHGKLIKLAGGIFHTHHYLADGRLEILTAYGAQIGLPTPILQQLFTSSTTEAALKLLREIDRQSGGDWVSQIYQMIAEHIDRRSQDYIRNHAEGEVCVGSVLFDRDRKILVKSNQGTSLLSKLCYNGLNIY